MMVMMVMMVMSIINVFTLIIKVAKAAANYEEIVSLGPDPAVTGCDGGGRGHWMIEIK